MPERHVSEDGAMNKNLREHVEHLGRGERDMSRGKTNHQFQD